MTRDTADDLYKLGFQLIDTGDFAGGLDALTRANELCPNDHEIIHCIGISLIGLCRIEEALATIQRAIDLFPDFPDALVSAGDCLAKLGRTSDARQAYYRGLQLTLPGEEAHVRIISTLKRLE